MSWQSQSFPCNWEGFDMDVIIPVTRGFLSRYSGLINIDMKSDKK